MNGANLNDSGKTKPTHDPGIETELRQLLSDLCRKDVTGVGLESDLVNELGLDSLGGLRLLAAVEKKFQVRFPDRRLGEFRTLRQLLDFIAHSHEQPL